MTSVRIQKLREPPSLSDAHRYALDKINAQFPDCTQLSALDDALREASSSRDALKDQLSASTKDIDDLIRNTRSTARGHLDTTNDLISQQESLAADLEGLSTELVSSMPTDGAGREPTLLEELETMHRSLKELESVRAYVGVTERALVLSEAAVKQIGVNPSPLTLSSTSEFQALQAFVEDVTQACSATEDLGNGDGPLHLVKFLRHVKDRTWSEIKATLSNNLISAAEKLKWPMPVDYVAADVKDRAAFEAAFADLARLQDISKQLHVDGTDSQSLPKVVGLYPLEALVQPIALRFKFHFDGTRETNRVDKPEWYFTHIINSAHDHRPFMEIVIQRLLNGTSYKAVNAWQNFTYLLLPILERKLRRTIPMLLTRPALLAHTVYQTLVFDSSLREMGFEFPVEDTQGAPSSDEPAGVSRVVLDRKEWFDAWLEGEKKFGEDQYHGIISASDAWLIADDEAKSNDDIHAHVGVDLKPTNSARRVKSLVEQVTDRYSPLPSFSQKTRFLIHVQLPIIESYHSRIASSLDAFETLSSALLRAVPGALGVDGPRMDTKRLTSGVEGSQRLCKALLSAKYIEAAMEGWGEDMFFVELWSEINRRAFLRVHAEAHPSLPDPNHPHGRRDSSGEVHLEGEGTIFEELIIQYSKLASRAEDILVSHVCDEIEGLLKPHIQAVITPKEGSQQHEDADSTTVPPTLLPAVALLSSVLKLLQSVLPSATTTRIYRRIASRVSEHILQREVMYRPSLTRGQYRTLPRAQIRALHAECELWAETCLVALRTTRSRAEAPWGKLLVAGRLLDADDASFERVSAALYGESDALKEVIDSVTQVGLGGFEMEEIHTIMRIRED